MDGAVRSRFDVVIVGAGLAGLTLSRQLLLDTNKTVLLLDRRDAVPGPTQKVGESLVQLSGYYLAKVLDMEEYLLRNHYLKYNLRFHWPTEGLDNKRIEDYCRSFIRLGSNIPTFQLDRNKFEAELLRVNSLDERFEFSAGLRDLDVMLAEDGGEHVVRFNGREIRANWVVDASGRGAMLKRKLELVKPNDIRHGSTWCWVEGLVNIEKLTDVPRRDVRVNRTRMKTGHMPHFLATNHFCGEGQWFWVIPLHGITSLGLVYDKKVIDSNSVNTAKKMIDYACEKWPLFASDLPNRKIVDEGRFYDYSYDARQTISPKRWAMTGEAGRFSDPLYSPGSDLISIYNTLIVDAVQTDCQETLERKCKVDEMIMRVMYEAYVPSYAVSYDCLGDRQAFTLKYGWELAVYFGFYVMPFINDMFTNEQFIPHFLRKFGLLGPINKNLQMLLSGYFQWKKTHRGRESQVMLNDFYEMPWLKNSEPLFYKVGLTAEECADTLDMHFDNLKQYAKWIAAQVYADVLEMPELASDEMFREKIKLRDLKFDPAKMREDYECSFSRSMLSV